MLYKSIFQGRLDFTNERSFQKVYELYIHRMENYYRMEVYFEAEDIFQKDRCRIVIPRTVVQLSEKVWKNTVNLLKMVSEFSVAGNIGAWMTDTGSVLHYALIVPNSEKTVVREYLRGVELIDQEGKEQEALDALTRTIDKYNKHSQAYERRGYVNEMLGNLTDAMYDFNKSIRIDPENAGAYLGRAYVHLKQEKCSDAILDFQNVIEKSIALQPVHWQARRKKGECHLALGEYEKAEFELKLFTRRKFEANNINYHNRPRAMLAYGEVLFALGKFEDCIQVLANFLTMGTKEQKSRKARAELLLGKSKKECGKHDFLKHWEESSRLGDKEAAKLVREHLKK